MFLLYLFWAKNNKIYFFISIRGAPRVNFPLLASASENLISITKISPQIIWHIIRSRRRATKILILTLTQCFENNCWILRWRGKQIEVKIKQQSKCRSEKEDRNSYFVSGWNGLSFTCENMQVFLHITCIFSQHWYILKCQTKSFLVVASFAGNKLWWFEDQCIRVICL